MDSDENGLEFFTGADTVTVWFSQRRFINRIKKLAEQYPDECTLDYVNQDGSILAHIPITWLKISPPRKNSFTEEQKQQSREKLEKAREIKRQKYRMLKSD